MALEGMGAVTLRVTPAKLKEKADEISKDIREMTTAFEQLADRISRTSHYWIGEAGDTCRSQYAEHRKEIDQMLKRLGEHPRDLLEMAQIYEAVEKRVTEISNALPEDVIS
jgi:WXG100 family type VII secretion target